MKSEILFRGKTPSGRWFYGDLFRFNDTLMSIAYVDKDYEKQEADVVPETVGAFTGYRALNYERIFEGDILKSLTGKYILVTDSGYGSWTFIDIQDGEFCRGINAEMLSCCQIIDNIHDNPNFVETYRLKF